MISNIPGGVTAAKGFSAACCAAGIKYRDRTDMAMVFSSVPCAAAGVFTSNKVKAAPVLWDMNLVRSGSPAQAVVVNAGIANAATGKTGLDLCGGTAEYAGKVLGIPASSVLIGSTGGRHRSEHPAGQNHRRDLHDVGKAFGLHGSRHRRQQSYHDHRYRQQGNRRYL